MRIRSLPSTIGILLLLPLPGCCSLARFFCGPDRTEWVSVDWSTPELAVKTLLESLRRSDPEILYQSLSDDYREKLGITKLTVELGWEQFCEANPGLHVAGYAEVPAPTRRDDDRAEFTLDIEGTKVNVSVVRQLRSYVSYRRDDAPDAEKEKVEASFAGIANIAVDKDASGKSNEKSWLSIGPLPVPHPNQDELPLARITAAGIRTVWRIDSISTLEEQ